MEQKDIENYLRGIASASKTLNIGANNMARAFERTASRIEHIAKSQEDQIKRFKEATDKVFMSLQDAASNMEPFVAKLHRAIEQLPQQTKNELEALAIHGWYIDPDMPCTASTELANLFIEGAVGEGNSLLERYYDSRSSIIESRLVGKFPSRKAVLSQAFSAHRNSMYALSVPVFLAQADGICKELLGVQLYGKTRGGNSTQVRDATDGLELGPYLESLLSPFLQPFAINYGSRQREENQLNRHAVLHGESVTYGTFCNSCKAISLIAFTEWALSERFGS